MREIGTTVSSVDGEVQFLATQQSSECPTVEKLRTFAVVELDNESAAYLETRKGYNEHDAYIEHDAR